MNNMLFSGKTLFELKATHGLPLDITINEVIIVRKMKITWDEYIECARINNWWDFQIIDSIEIALQDSGLEKDMISEIINRTKLYMLKYIHPKMIND